MELFIFITVILAIGFIIGYRVGGHSVRNENTTLYNQVSMLTQFSKFWSGQAQEKQLLSSQIAQQINTNTAATIHTVIQLLQVLQREQTNTLNNEEQNKITQLIQQAKSITSP